MAQTVLVECWCGWSDYIDMANFEPRCPNGHRIEEVTPLT